MKRSKNYFLVSVAVLMFAVLSFGQTSAEKPSASGQLIGQEEYTKQELVPINEAKDGPQILVDVHYVEKTYAVYPDEKSITGENNNTLMPSFTLTLSHSQAKWRNEGSACYTFTVRAGGKTTSNQCLDYIYVKASTYGSGTESTGNSGTDWWGCKDDTGWQYENSTWAQGQTVYTRGDHTGRLGTTEYNELNADWPSTYLDYEPQCTG